MRKTLFFVICLFICFKIYAVQSPYTQIITDTNDIPTDFPFKELENKSEVAPFIECYHFTAPDCPQAARGYYYVFRNKNQNLKEKYNFSGPDELSSIVYHATDGTIRNIIKENQFGKYLICFNNKLFANKDYFMFDNSGRAFISVINTNYDTPEILMYDPQTDKRARLIPDPKLKIILDFDITEDGEYLFVNGRRSLNKDSPLIIYSIKTSNLKYNTIYKCPFGYSEIPMICYYPKTKSLYFTALSATEVTSTAATIGLPKKRSFFDYGTFVLRPNEDGSYSPKGLYRYAVPDAGQVRFHLEYYITDPTSANNSGGKNNYEPFLKYLYTFADAGSNPIFAVTKSNNTVATEIEALKYLNEKKDLESFMNDKNGPWLNLGHWLYRVDENGNVTNESAYTHNGAKSFEKGFLFSTSTAFFYPYDDKLYAAVNRFERISNNSSDTDWETFVCDICEVIDRDGDFYFFQLPELKNINPASYHNEMPLLNPMQRTPIFETTSAGLLINDNDGKRVHIYKDGKVVSYKNRIDFETSQIKADLKYIENPNKTTVKASNEELSSQDNSLSDNTLSEPPIIDKSLSDNSPLDIPLSDISSSDISASDNSISENSNSNNLLVKKLKIFILILLLIILLGIVVASILIYKKIKSQKEELKRQKIFKYNIQEEERAKISRDIHDSVVQDIRTIRLAIELLKVKEESDFQLKKIIDLTTNCILKLRNICYNLTPAELVTHQEGDSAEIELISMIKNLVVQFTERTHIPCTLNIEENFKYPVFEKETNVQLFRIMQEALTNIEKHSYATSSKIFIKDEQKENQKYMIIYITDDGIGCDINKMHSKRKKLHFGISSMEERIKIIGGTIEFFSNTGDGMEIRLSIPVK
ncbi:MAG: sensor histidine kinase [Treponema sp.]|nr:sensor histidine kinase [Treponema sp.]